MFKWKLRVEIQNGDAKYSNDTRYLEFELMPWDFFVFFLGVDGIPNSYVIIKNKKITDIERPVFNFDDRTIFLKGIVHDC